MKKYVFAYTEIKRTISRTYGGSNYTLAVYDLTGGKVERIGTVEACTRGHKGEASEAWGVVIAERPSILRTLSKRAEAAGDSYALKETKTSYYTHHFKELGVELHVL